MATPPIDALTAQAGFARRLARELVGDAARADDVVQDAYVAALEHPPRPGPGLRAWFGRVVANAAWRLRRDEARRIRREQVAARSEALPSEAEIAARLAAQRALLDAVAALDEPYRSVLEQRYLLDLKPAAIARAQGLHVRNVETRLRRALERLRVDLDRRFEGGRSAWAALLLPAIGGSIVSTKAKVLAGVALAAVLAWMAVTLEWGRGRPRLANESGASAVEPATAHSAELARAASVSDPASNAATAPVAQRADARCSVTVTTPDGAGLAGAGLVLFCGENLLGVATTDEDGNALLPVARQTSELLMLPGCAPRRRITVAADSNSIDVSLADGEVLSGRVTLDGRAPDPSIELKLRAEAMGGDFRELPDAVSRAVTDHEFHATGQLVARTDADGRFLFCGLSRGKRLAVYVPAPYEDAKSGEPVFPFPQPREDVELALTFNPSISGRLVDRSAAPLAGWQVDGWTVGASKRGWESQGSATTDADGGFHVLVHDKSAGANCHAWLELHDPAGVPVRSIEIEHLHGFRFDVGEVVVDAMRTLAIDARDADGKRVEPFVVAVERTIPEPLQLHEPRIVVDGPHARAGFVLPEDRATLHVLAAGYAAADVPCEPADTLEIVTLERCAQLVFGVRDAEQRRMRGCSLEIAADEWPAAWTLDSLEGAHALLGGSEIRFGWKRLVFDRSLENKRSFKVVSQDGAPFRVVGLRPDRPLTLVVRDHLGIELLRDDVTLVAGETRELERVVTKPAGVITGCVRTADGTPPPKARIEWSDPQQTFVDLAWTEKDGSFRIEDVRIPRVMLWFQPEGLAWKVLRDVEVGDGTQPLEVELAKGRFLRCAFSVLAQHVVEDVWIERTSARPSPESRDVRPGAEDCFVPRHESDGHYWFESLPDGALQLRACVEGFTYCFDDLQPDSSYNIILTGPVEIEWRLSDREVAGRALRAVRLSPRIRSERASATAFVSATDDAHSGRVRFEKLPVYQTYHVVLVWDGADGKLVDEDSQLEFRVSEANLKDSHHVLLER